jgi:hypothetical protein
VALNGYRAGGERQQCGQGATRLWRKTRRVLDVVVHQRARGGEGQLYFWHQVAGEVLDANAMFQDKFDSVARVKRHEKEVRKGEQLSSRITSQRASTRSLAGINEGCVF